MKVKNYENISILTGWISTVIALAIEKPSLWFSALAMAYVTILGVWLHHACQRGHHA